MRNQIGNTEHYRGACYSPAPVKKVSRTAVVISCIAGGIALLIAAAVLFVLLSPALRVSKGIEAGDYGKAVELYEKSVEDDEIQTFMLDFFLNGRVKDTLNAYEAGNIGFDQVMPELNALIALGYIDAR